MYLVQLYKKNKWWFIVVALFAFGQVFINSKNGLMISPFLNYDMYSNPTFPHQQYGVVQIRVNGQLLQPKDFSPNEWDNLIQPIVFFDKQKDWNSLIFNRDVQKFLSIKDSVLYVNNISDQEFLSWYKKQVIRIANVQNANCNITISRDSFLLAQQYLYTK